VIVIIVICDANIKTINLIYGIIEISI